MDDFFDDPPPPYEYTDPNRAASTVTPSTIKSEENGTPHAHRILHVYHQGLTHRDCHVLDSDKKTELYGVQVHYGTNCFNSTPHSMIITSTTTTTTTSTDTAVVVIGTVTFNAKTPDMQLTIHNRHIPLTWSGSLLSGHRFQSATATTNGAAAAKTYTWKLQGGKAANIGDMVCLNEENRLVARFYINNGAFKKEGRFELGSRVTGVLMDEIVVSGLAIVESRRRRPDR